MAIFRGVALLVLGQPGGVGRQRVGWLLKALPLRLLGRRGLVRSVRVATGLDTEEVRPAVDYLVLIFTHFRPRTERLPVFPDEALRRLAMPVLVLVGERDAMLDSRGTARRMRRCVPHATVTVLPGTGHSILGQTGPIAAFLGAEEAADA